MCTGPLIKEASKRSKRTKEEIGKYRQINSNLTKISLTVSNINNIDIQLEGRISQIEWRKKRPNYVMLKRNEL